MLPHTRTVRTGPDQPTDPKVSSMSSTPLFDSIARDHDGNPVARATFAPAPTSPMTAPVAPAQSMFVPAALVAAIDEILTRIGSALVQEHAVRADQLALVEAVADAITRAVVDAVVAELDRIAADGIVRA